MKILILSIFSLIISACSSNMPAPSVSAYVKTDGGGFLMEKNDGIKYAMTYTLLKPSESADSYRTVFESTIPNGKPVISKGSIQADVSELRVQSPVISGVKNNHTYIVTLELYAGDKIITSHIDKVRFSVHSNILAQFKIKEY